MVILGINAYHGDSSACIVINGEIIAAIEEERLIRIKHWAGFPIQSIKFCLEKCNLNIDNVDYICINRDPRKNLFRKFFYLIFYKKNFSFVIDRIKNRSKIKSLSQEIASNFNASEKNIKKKIRYIEHHFAHLSSSFYTSNFNKAAVVSVDGFGDFASTAWGIANNNKILIDKKIFFPHSLGIFYLAITQFLGFHNYGDEYKVMGLAPYGEPSELKKMRDIVLINVDGTFKLNLKYFKHHNSNISMTWNDGEPIIGNVYSDKLIELFGPERKKDEPISQHYKNIAASAQFMYEEALFNILNFVHEKYSIDNLALSGGCAMNSVANGKIFSNTKFKEIYIQSAAGDSGGSIGAAFAIWNNMLNKPRNFYMNHSYFGPEFSNNEISVILKQYNNQLPEELFSISIVNNEDLLTKEIAYEISKGKIIGWFQGRMEWGPRALGNRSILGDPRRSDMKQILNNKIKRRESFRPFAPSILEDRVNEWFEVDYPVPFMLQVFQIKPEKRTLIPAVTHVNGSGRLQSVTPSQNFLYYKLISNFYNLTGVPILLNTSFNENEPIVCRPQEAIDCFLRTKMDILVLKNYIIRRNI